MARAFFSTIFLVVFSIFIIAGCSSNPAVPEIRPADEPQAAVQATPSSHQLMGYHFMVIDTSSGEFDIIPARSAEWHFNLTGILNSTMGVGAAGVPAETDLASGIITMDITLAHPFATNDNLSGFDVKGILIVPGTLNTGSHILSDTDETCLVNADGFTRWWNPTEFTSTGIFGYTDGLLASHPGSMLTATVNPYKLFADVLSPTDALTWVVTEPMDSDNGRAVFRAGSTNTRRYTIQFPMNPGPQVVYGYAVDCSWNTASPNPPSEVPDDFPMNANQPEAYRVVLQPTADTLYYDTESGIGGGVLRLQINVHDWQGQASGDFEAETSSVEIFAPDLFAGPIPATYLNQTADKARYVADLTGTAIPSAPGEVRLACRVVSSDGGTYKQAGAPAPTATVSSWQVITLEVDEADCHGDANNDFGEAVDINLGDSVEGQVCLPDDYRDYYMLSIDPVYAVTGSIDLYCDAEPTTIGVYKMNEELVYEESVTGGMASISSDEVMFYPRDYYLRIFTSNDTQVSPYLLEMNLDLVDVTPSSPVEITPDELYVDPSECYFRENIMYAIGYRGLWTYDITDPADPVLLYYDYTHYSGEFAFDWPYMYYKEYVASPEVYHVSAIDLTDPSNPVFHSSIIENDDNINKFEINSDYLFMIYEVSNDRHVGIYDRSTDPLAPTEVWSSTTPLAEGFYCGLRLVNGESADPYLLVWGEGTLELYDVSQPDVFVDHLDSVPPGTFGGSIRDIATQGNYFFVIRSESSNGYFASCRVTPGESISVLASISISPGPSHATTSGDYAYVGAEDFLEVINISDTSNPDSIETLPLAPYCAHVNVHDDILSVVPIYTGFELYSITYPALPSQIYKTEVINNPKEVELFDHYALVADDDYNTYHLLKVVDISDPANPVTVEVFEVAESIMYMTYVDGYALVSVGWDLVIFDCTNPLSLSIVETIDLTDLISFYDIYEDTLYITTGGADLYVFDATDPAEPVYLTHKATNGNGLNMVRNGDYLYMTTSNDLIEIFSISNPHNPTSQGTYSTGSPPSWLMTQDDYLYVSCVNSVEILDISSPTSPVYLGSVLGDGADSFKQASTDGLFGYIGGGHMYWCNPTIISLWPPDSPDVVYKFDPFPYISPYNMEVADGILYMAASKGFRIYDLY